MEEFKLDCLDRRKKINLFTIIYIIEVLSGSKRDWKIHSETSETKKILLQNKSYYAKQ